MVLKKIKKNIALQCFYCVLGDPGFEISVVKRPVVSQSEHSVSRFALQVEGKGVIRGKARDSCTFQYPEGKVIIDGCTENVIIFNLRTGETNVTHPADCLKINK